MAPKKRASDSTGKRSRFEIAYTRFQGQESTLDALNQRLRGYATWPTDAADERRRAHASITAARDGLRAQVNRSAIQFDLPIVELPRPEIPSSEELRRQFLWMRLMQKRRGVGRQVPVSSKRIVIDPIKVPIIFPVVCENREGFVELSQVKQYTIGTPDDNDTESWMQTNYLIEGSKNTIEHKSYIDDQTHWYSSDDAEYYAYWFALGYEIPAVPCDGYLSWSAYARHHLKLGGGAEYRHLFTQWLLYPGWEVWDWPGGEPAALDDFSRYLGVDFTNDNVDGYDLSGEWSTTPEALLLGGDLNVKRGDKVKVWIGSYVFLAGREGVSKTGWNLFRVWSEDFLEGLTLPAIRYYFMPA